MGIGWISRMYYTFGIYSLIKPTIDNHLDIFKTICRERGPLLLYWKEQAKCEGWGPEFNLLFKPGESH